MKATHFSTDIQEFLILLHQYEVKYLIVGGEAVIYYGNPRLTGDVYFIGLQHLIINKEKAGRDKDREDLKYLRSIK